MTGAAPLQARGGDGSLQVTVDASAVQRVLNLAPKIVYFWLHGFLHRSFVLHRLKWLRAKGARFGRGGDGGRAIKVHEVNRGPEAPQDTDVVYRVTPTEQRPSSVRQAVEGLRALQAEAFAGSVVLRVHEFGEDVRARSGFMAVPIKTRPKTPRKWQAANPGKRLEFRPSKKFAGEGALYEVTKVRGRGRPRKGQTLPALREKLRLRFVLKRVVEMNPTLGMYRTWDELAAQRETLWTGAAAKMEQQLARGDTRDF